MWRKTRKPNYGTSCIGTDPNRNWGHKWGGEYHWSRSFQLAVRSTTLVNTHWLPAKLWRCRAMQEAYIRNQRLRLQMHRSESESIIRNPRSRHSGIHLCDRNPSFLPLGNRIRYSRSGIHQSGSTIHLSESGIGPSRSGIRHEESRMHGRHPGFNTRPYFYLFPLTLREHSVKQPFCHTFSSRCQQKSLSRWLSRFASIFRGRSAQRCQLLESAEPTA